MLMMLLSGWHSCRRFFSPVSHLPIIRCRLLLLIMNWIVWLNEFLHCGAKGARQLGGVGLTGRFLYWQREIFYLLGREIFLLFEICTATINGAISFKRCHISGGALKCFIPKVFEIFKSIFNLILDILNWIKTMVTLSLWPITRPLSFQ